MGNVIEFQSELLNEINNPEKGIFLAVQKKTLKRSDYLSGIRKRCKEAELTGEETEDIVSLVDKTLWGFGILDELVDDPEVSDIRLVNENIVRIKKNGKRYATNIKFKDRKSYEDYIEFITSRNNTNMSFTNAAQVFTDNTTCATDILRFSLTSSLVNSGGCPSLLIRKIPKIKKTFDTLIKQNYCTPAQVEYLRKRWADGYGILVCGPNGSGKTTLTNAILESTPKNKSCVVIQESEELFCHTHPEMIFRKIVPPRQGAVVAYGLKELAKLALMESFDIMVIGEIKGDEAADLSMATYTGAQGMATVHSNSAKEAYEKIIDYALDAQPNRSRNHFAKQIQSLSTCVFVKDYHIADIVEVVGYDQHTGEYEFRTPEINVNKEQSELINFDV